MSTRLVWNFEIDTGSKIPFPSLPHADKESLRWESRFFWPEDTIITVHGLDETYLNLSHYESKHRSDTYYLLADYDFNLKQRRGEWLYKPLLQESESLQGFGKKINVRLLSPDTPIPAASNISAGQLLTLLEQNSRPVTVEKEALIYRFDSKPTIKMELSRLDTDLGTFFSACVEGRCASLVTQISNHLFPKQTPCGYVPFLKQEIIHD
ncbi:hypothetical protein [Legionella spiritensis]|uniref:hypothetical protein n=1 Tax=Legionella spiritensis TaxID=452 RepID=UPI000F6D3849|nr:hypothetical protein [Legionella spiritensis]VEG91842.1 Uncharacterised protein [Legionella spiritensis]